MQGNTCWHLQFLYLDGLGCHAKFIIYFLIFVLWCSTPFKIILSLCELTIWIELKIPIINSFYSGYESFILFSKYEIVIYDKPIYKPISVFINFVDICPTYLWERCWSEVWGRAWPASAPQTRNRCITVGDLIPYGVDKINSFESFK